MCQPGLLSKWRASAGRLKSELLALYLAYRDPRVPWYARVFIACIVAYAFSPIDLVPDFVPILGYLDDLLLLPLGVALALKMIPASIMDEHRQRVESLTVRPRSILGAAVIVMVWIVVAAWLIGVLVSRSR